MNRKTKGKNEIPIKNCAWKGNFVLQRNHNIDVFRGCALLLVMIYHLWVLTGSQELYIPFIKEYIFLGGEIGVTAFFVLSGYGIYCSLERSPVTSLKSYFTYCKKRFLRVAPQYYASLFVCILIADAAPLSVGCFRQLLTHLLFVHNWFSDCHGAINGALWTMGVTVQFYLVAPVLYALIKKNKYLVCALCIAISIALQGIIYKILDPAYWFMYCRQLFTALDNFAIGMLVAAVVTERKKIISKPIVIGELFAGIVGIYIVVCQIFNRVGYTATLWGCVWHTLLAGFLGVIVLSLSVLDEPSNKAYKALLWFSRYEYGIYIYHLVIIRNMLNNSGWIQSLAGGGLFLIAWIIMAAASVGIGYMSEICTFHVTFQKERRRP